MALSAIAATMRLQAMWRRSAEMDSDQRVVRTADGRQLAVAEAGDRDGRPVLAHMGTPNSRRLYAPLVADAVARGIRLISYDRPGYGGSTGQPGGASAERGGDGRGDP